MIDINEYAELIEMAKGAAEKAYAPYSDFTVGAAILTGSGKIYTGCNVENMSFGAAICAERTAAVKAVSEGETEFVAIAVYHPGSDMPYPCGVCRQFLSEFGRRAVIIAANETGSEAFELRELLPCSFEFRK